ncbi:glycosyltransferase [Propionivibrio soli]|uniref:glycosyltransferase n=1 Tax=Propionivibrio soli TaxID=2976531 RepID=UPI0021E94DEC|nr:glycosyltransferase [Propionivibrio soli]
MNRRVKLLQIQPDYHENSHNYSDLAEQIIAAFPKERYTVTSAFLRGKPEPGHPKSRADETVYFNFPDTMLRGLRLRLMWEIYRFCKKGDYDVIICNRYKQTNLLMVLNHLLRIPVCVGIAHGFGAYDPFWRRQRMRVLVDASWRFVGVSPAVASYLIEKRCGFTESNTVAITNALDIEQVEANQLSRAEARRALGLPAEGRIIGAAGRLVRVKGHDHLIEAFSRVAAKHPDAMLAIIGEGREREFLEGEIAHLKLKDRVKLLGFRAGAKQYVRAFDIWAMPSLTEGLGLALLEGMNGHLPVIASDIPAMRPLVDGAGGIAVPPADVTALAAALDRYLSLSTDALRAKGEQAYSYLRANHGIETYRRKYLELVESALSSRGIALGVQN